MLSMKIFRAVRMELSQRAAFIALVSVLVNSMAKFRLATMRVALVDVCIDKLKW